MKLKVKDELFSMVETNYPVWVDGQFRQAGKLLLDDLKGLQLLVVG